MCKCFLFVYVCAQLRMTLSSEVSIEFSLNEISTLKESVRSEAFVSCVWWEQGPRQLRKALHMQSGFGIAKCSLRALV